MSIEKKVGFQGPLKFVVATVAPAMKDGVQKIGRAGAHKDLPQWYSVGAEPNNVKVTIYQQESPKQGDVYEESWIEGKDWQGQIYFDLHTKEQKAKGGVGGNSGGAGAPKRDYTIENRQVAVAAVIAHLQGKGDMNTICTHAAALVDFYKNGTIPPPKAQQP